jgi:hypothetical protein
MPHYARSLPNKDVGGSMMIMTPYKSVSCAGASVDDVASSTCKSISCISSRSVSTFVLARLLLLPVVGKCDLGLGEYAL